MNVLLDTHVLLWWLNDDDKLSEKARTIIRNPANFIYISAATGWEIAIKKVLGKLLAPNNIIEAI
jgi:PIN domain nuclease of toxin-antitoxin system